MGAKLWLQGGKNKKVTGIFIACVRSLKDLQDAIEAVLSETALQLALPCPHGAL